jgi:hypothetical protein
MRLADFVIIGAMKSATGTLHGQLALQPGICMTTPKEPCFFSTDEVYEKGLDWYASLFAEAAPTDLCGESSTLYSKLPTFPHTLERMQEHLPDAKLVYIMRHPMDRLVSQYVHEWRMRMISEPIDSAIKNFPILHEYSRYSMQLKPFLEAYGPENVLPVFFEQLRLYPQELLERICRFIGYEGAPQWREERAHQHMSKGLMKKNRIRDAIVFAPGISTLREALIPRSVRNRVKAFWQMKEPPVLSEASIAWLEEIFDQDLATLGTWLGTELTCANFKEVTAKNDLKWRNPLSIGP